ncbi:hypothetical protein GQX73_g393 [Xylaria multiplex]|uniref:NAD-dependent epimerase/dehydratase domain-containing protein n=1 Tax=Xylaria multiplex TaxID=323545 RepID=A0A7C8N130_9PEZI|nr:hypothetical protein GQX73_g393 [Xylaria multiplex]
MSPIDQPAIPKGSTVLVTGGNGFIGSNISDQLLKLGYKVRGTTRNPQKNKWVSDLFDRKYGPGQFELVAVPDMVAENAYDEAVKVAGTVNALAAAAKVPSIKRFVLTSSSASALIPKPNNPVTVTTETWNEETVQYAYRDPPYEEERGYPVYAASKILSEKEAWKFMAEKKPGFVLNTVLPNLNFGASLDFANQGHASTSGLVVELFKGNWQPLAGLPVQYFVDVQDTALLHAAAVIHPDVESERIFSFAEPLNGDKMLAILRKLYPDRTFPENFQGDNDLSDIVPRKRALELLRDMGKTEGWTSLEESIRRNTENLV